MWPVIIATFGGAYVFSVWVSIEEKTLKTFWYSSWERRCVNLIFSPDLAGDVN